MLGPFDPGKTGAGDSLDQRRAALDNFIFCDGIKLVPRDEALRQTKGTREGVTIGLGAGLFCPPDDRTPEKTEFIQKRLGNIVQHGQWFDFGHIDNKAFLDADRQWGPFASAGLIDLPYPQTVFRVRHTIRDASTDMPEAVDMIYVAEQEKIGAPLTICLLTAMHLKFEPVALLSFFVFTKATLQAYALTTKKIDALFFPLWLILNTKGIPKTLETPAARVNELRERRGLPPLMPYTKIDANAYITALRETIRMESDKSGSHASPHPHLRRAHLRHLDSVRVVPVMATIVNGSSGLKARTREKYQVTQ